MSVNLVTGSLQYAVTDNAAGTTANTFNFNGTSFSIGDLLVFRVHKNSGGTSDPFVAGDVTKTAGSATIGAISMDAVDSIDLGGGLGFLNHAVYSCIVTGAGTVTLTAAGGQVGEYWNCGGGGWSSTVGWDASRVENTNKANTATDTTVSASSGSASYAGNALAFGSLGLDGTGIITITPVVWSQVGESENAGSSLTGSATYSIKSSGGSDSAQWVLAYSLSDSWGWSAIVVIYKEAGGAAADQPTQDDWSWDDGADWVDQAVEQSLQSDPVATSHYSEPIDLLLLAEAFYDQPTIEEFEHFAPVGANAPPNAIEDAWDHFTDEADQFDLTQFDDDDDAVGPNETADQPTDDGWEFVVEVEDDYFDHFGNEDADQSLIEDSWDHFADELDNALSLGEDPLAANGAPNPQPDEFDHWVDLGDALDEHQASAPVSDVEQPTADAWDHWADLGDHDLLELDQAFTDAVTQADQPADDAWEHFADELDNALALDDVLSGDGAPNGPDDPWDHWAEEIEPIEGPQEPLGADGAAAPPSIPDDAWDHYGDEPEPLQVPDEPIGADGAPPPSDDAWDHFGELVDDDVAQDQAPADVIAGGSIEDLWDHFGELVEDDINQAEMLDSPAGPPLPPDDAWDWAHDPIPDFDQPDEAVGPNQVVPPSTIVEDAWDWWTWDDDDLQGQDVMLPGPKPLPPISGAGQVVQGRRGSYSPARPGHFSRGRPTR